jgi:methyl-accepting chemotaxis protein
MNRNFQGDDMTKKLSFTALFTLICVSATVLTTVAVMLLFFINFRRISHEQIEAFTQESISRVQDNVRSMLTAHEDLLKTSVVGVNALLRAYNGAVPSEVMRSYFVKTMRVLPDVSFLYYSNNIKWDRPGSYFVLHDGWIPDDPAYDQTQRAWFTAAKNRGGNIAYSDPYIEASQGNLTIAISATIFDDEGRDIGVVCEEITVNSLEKLLKSSGGEHKMYLLDRSGMCIIDADGGPSMELDFFREKGLEKFRSEILSKSDFAGSDTRDFIYSAYIPGSDAGADYYLVSTLSAKAVFAKVNRLFLSVSAVSLLALLLVAFITVFITRKMAHPLTKLEGFAAVLADGDFSQTSPDYAIEESSRLAVGFNTINKNISSLIGTIEGKAKFLKGVSGELAERMKVSTTDLAEIRASIAGMKNKSINQAASITETNATMGQIVGSIEALNHNIEEQSSSVSRSSSAIEQMTASIASVTSTLAQNGENMKRLQSAAEKGHNALMQVSQDIQEVSQESERLLEINQVIQSIASQTNLLSMNAAIEAAHAGEVGKGFAVVADEIRKLAESSSQQAKTVAEVLKKIKQALDGIGRSSEAMITHFDDIDESVKTVSDQEIQIRGAVEEEDVGSKEILKTITTLNDITELVKRSSQEMLLGSKQIISEGKNLDAMTSELNGGINDIAESVEHISDAVTRANEISVENRQSIDDLATEMSRFRIGRD